MLKLIRETEIFLSAVILDQVTNQVAYPQKKGLRNSETLDFTGRGSKSTLIYETILTSVENFHPNLKMKGVTNEFLRKYENHLSSKSKAISTIGIHLRQIRVVCNYAIKKKYILAEKYPFKNFTVPAAQKNKRALSDKDIKTLIEYKTDKPEEKKAIDFW
ncbi:MAG: phage integrase SAM-like domain-containing protein, partial [Bacteroidales bacterium]